MDEVNYELCQLHLCDILFPPQRFLAFRIDGAQQIINIHYDVDECVEYGNCASMAAETLRNCVEVYEGRHHYVVVDVQDRYLFIAFPQYEKQRFQIIDKLVAEV